MILRKKPVSKFQVALLKNENIAKVYSAVEDRNNKTSKKQDPLKPYIQMGFEELHRTGDNDCEVVGICPFCDSDKFFINVDKKVFSCKMCGHEGGYKTFINTCFEEFRPHFAGEVAQKLCENRGLSLETLMEHQICYNPKTRDYIIPTFDSDNIEITSLKRFCLLDDGTKYFLNLSGSHQCLFNSHLLNDHPDSTIFLVEGEWDCMAMKEAINQVSGKKGFKDNYVAVAVPGATSMKDDWISYFKDRDVIVVFDNDKTRIGRNGKKAIIGAGTQGGLKAYKKLSPVVKSIKFMHWQVGTKHKYDVRDCYIDNDKVGSKLIKYIWHNCRIYPKGLDREKLVQKKSSVMEGAGVSADQVRNVFGKWLALKDNSVIDILFGTFIGNRYSMVDPIWLFLVARSGFCKSELIMSFQEVCDAYVLSTLSENALVSGMVMVDSKEDMSLLPKLNENILLIKDYTTILTGSEKASENIMGQLRSIYDGDFSKAYGTVERRYKSNFGFIAGVTHIIEIYVAKNPAYGERFLMYNIDDDLTYDESISVIMQALSNSGQETVMRQEIKDVTNKCLHHKFHKPNISRQNMLNIATMSQCLAILRGATIRDKYRPDEILGAPKPEIGTRIAKALMKLAQGIAAFNGRPEVTEYELRLISAVIRSSVPSAHMSVVEKMVKGNKDLYTEKELIKFVGLTRKKSQQILSNLTYLKVITPNVRHDGGYRTIAYKLQNNLKNLILAGKILR